VLILFLFICVLIVLRFYFSNRDIRPACGVSKREITYAEHIGEKGEKHLAAILEKIPGEKRILMNCYVPTNEGTTEIDVLLIHETGVYVFESKNYSGWIYGSTDQRKWTQTFNFHRRYKHGREVQKYHFMNPIMQNKLHIKWLKKYFSNKFDRMIPFHSIVVFGDNCVIKTPIAESDNHTVLYSSQVAEAINQKFSTSNQFLSSEEIDHLYEMLIPLTHTSESIKQQHILRIQEKHSKNGVPNSNQIYQSRY